MKTLQKSITVYVSDDGKQFMSEEGCKAYETKLDRAKSFAEMKAKVDAIEHIENGEAPFGCGYIDVERYEYRWFRPKTTEELKALAEFFDIDVGDAVSEWVCIEIEDGYDDYTGAEDVYAIMTLDCSIDRLTKALAEFGYSLTIKKLS